MRVLSLFSGIGGFDLAFDMAGLVTDAFVEIDANCQAVLSRHFAHVLLCDDIRGVNGKWFAGIDVVCGGFPCQDLSLAGKRAGLAGERSGLWHEFARIVQEAEPTWVIIENVPGLLSSNRGRDLGAVVGALGDMGYGWAYRVLNAQGFGVPQRRRRVFIVANNRSAGRAAEILFDGESVCGNPTPRGKTGEDVANDPSTCVVSFQPRIARCDWGLPETVAPALNASETGLHGDSQPHVAGPFGVRRLTPRECERLQGFPDDWTAGHPDTARYRMIGNAVAVPVVEWIGRRLNCKS